MFAFRWLKQTNVNFKPELCIFLIRAYYTLFFAQSLQVLKNESNITYSFLIYLL